MTSSELSVLSFSNQTKEDKKKLKQFVKFHWSHYRNDPGYIPLLNYEYLGLGLIGMTGFFEPKDLFYNHAEIRFFMAEQNNTILGHCAAFVNHRHNAHWNDQTGFFGQFECINDEEVAGRLLDAAAQWLGSKGMDTMRGPQNFPVNEATPGLLTEGFESRPVIYYHYNKPYYAGLLDQYGMKPVKRVLSWEVKVQNPMEEKLERISEKVIKRYHVQFEAWDERPLDVRKKEMLDIYNTSWNDNFGFVPFTEEEFYQIVDDMMLIMDKNLFMFLYVEGQPAAFFGGIPNVMEALCPIPGLRRAELLRGLKMLLNKNKTKGFRLGYLGVKPEFRRLGLDGVMLYKQKQYTQTTQYEYCDMGWVLEDNVMVVRLVDMMGGGPSKTYTIYEKPIAGRA